MSLFCRTLFLYYQLTILIISDLWSYYHPPKNFPYLSLSALFLLSSYFVAPVLLLIFHLILYIPALFLSFLSQFLFFLLIVFSPYLSYFYFPSLHFISLPLAAFLQQVQLLLTHFYWLFLPFLLHIVFVKPSSFFLSALMNKPFLRPVYSSSPIFCLLLCNSLLLSAHFCFVNILIGQFCCFVSCDFWSHFFVSSGKCVDIHNFASLKAVITYLCSYPNIIL